MRRLALLLLPVALFAGQARYARLGEFDGKVEVQLQASDAWMPAERNLPLIELAWIRTGPGARVEIEFDDGGVWRLGPDSQGEISDYARLSTGQLVTLLSLDHGVAYFTGKPGANDSLALAVPGAMAIFTQAARLRLEAKGEWSQISILEGSVKFSSPAAAIELPQGVCARVEPANRERFFLERKIPALDLDGWSADRDKLLAFTTAQHHVLTHYGLADLDAGGAWVATDQFGAVWKPKVVDGWTPFQKGRWRWYDTLGFTWVSDDPWGWLPYHYGRWTVSPTLGWIWSPSLSQTFKPGDVYWLRGAKLAGWGPLAPGEHWSPPSQPELLANAYTTWAALQPDARTIDPAGFTARPEEPLSGAVLAIALPSPEFPATRLDALRPVLQAGSMRLKPFLPGVTYGSDPEPPPEPEPATSPSQQPTVVVFQPSAGVPFEATPPPDPAVVAYPVPVLAGIFTVTPPRETRASEQKASAPTPSPGTTTASAPGARPPSPKPPGSTGKPPAASAPPGNSRSRELEIYNDVLRDGNDPAKLLDHLQTWSREFPRTPYADERAALFVQAYASVKPPQPSKALELGSQLMARDLQALFPDPQRGPVLILSVLYSMTLSSWNVPHRTQQETAAGLAAARQLVAYTPAFFARSRKPSNVADDAWTQARTAVETTARQTVALLGSESASPLKPAGAAH